MQCVRCLKDTASKIAEAPDGSGAWDLYFCERCHYSWRNCEQDFITDIDKRDPWGQMGDVEEMVGTRDAGPRELYITIKEKPKA
jgi:hypothetical protein